MPVFSGLLLISGANPALAADQAAFVYVAHKNDYGWSYSHDIGRLKAEKSLQGKFKTSYIENILIMPTLNVHFGDSHNKEIRLYLLLPSGI